MQLRKGELVIRFISRLRLVIKNPSSALTAGHQTVSLCVFVSIELIHPPRRAVYYIALDDEEYIVQPGVR